MKNLATKYMGLTMKNPIIAASCGMTGSLESIKTLARSGAGAVVLKSIFEEEILLEVNQQLREAEKNPVIYSGLSETLDYIDLHIREDSLGNYLELIREAKKAVDIPVIASINCVTYEDWTYFTGKTEEAGADGLELNLFLNPADFESKEFEKVYFKIIEKVLGTVSIPVSIKISRYFTRMGLTVKALSETGIAGIVMFNRFYTPDIDIEKGAMVKGKYFSTPEEQSETLRWIAIMSRKSGCDLAASTGIHTGEDAIKMLLAGASAVQVASTLYKHGPDQIGRMLKRMEKWMDEQGYQSIEAFKGKATEDYQKNPAAFERMQFMKYYSEIR
ncbi:MAG TPA: dihydroorotate dehydrogenase-like protein [Bacteroides sp.]|nr:dihydroorotate dehydrogenase-like protein [Bacteroides sp.]